MNKVSLHHQYQEYSKDDQIQKSFEISDLVSNDQILAIANENTFINTVWYVYVIDTKCVDYSSNNIDNYSYSIPESQPYLLCNYLEKLDGNKKGVIYQRSNKKRFSFTNKVMNILNEFEQITSKNKNYFFLVMIDLLKF